MSSEEADVLPALEETSIADLKDILTELDHIAARRKLLENSGPCGHLVIPIYHKLKKHLNAVQSEAGSD